MWGMDVLSIGFGLAEGGVVGMLHAHPAWRAVLARAFKLIPNASDRLVGASFCAGTPVRRVLDTSGVAVCVPYLWPVSVHSLAATCDAENEVPVPSDCASIAMRLGSFDCIQPGFEAISVFFSWPRPLVSGSNIRTSVCWSMAGPLSKRTSQSYQYVGSVPKARNCPVHCPVHPGYKAFAVPSSGKAALEHQASRCPRRR